MDQSPKDVGSDLEDIIFECPQCGKSLEIDSRGAGYLIVCPDCKNEIQVPSWDETEEVVESPAPAMSEEEAIRKGLEETILQLQAKVEGLDKNQRADDLCFKRLSDEFSLIQASLDRITEIIESRQTKS